MSRRGWFARGRVCTRTRWCRSQRRWRIMSNFQPPAPSPQPPAPSLYACLYQPPAPDVFDDQRGTHRARRDSSEKPSAISALTVVSPLVQIAEAFSPRYERHGDDLVSIDIRGLDRLLGSPRTI